MAIQSGLQKCAEGCGLINIGLFLMHSTDNAKFTFKNDLYTQKRGRPVLLAISCKICSQYLMAYQKDGPGPLLRCYLDRIHHPTELKQLQYKSPSSCELPNLQCIHCKNVIGVPMVYQKENRLAFLLNPASFKVKKIYRFKLLMTSWKIYLGHELSCR
jgi:hypothetical protein